jgi:putative tricarboxylic transport membrane protein
VILVFGVAAYFMEENGFPVAPAILGVILGTMLEEHFITSMIKSEGRFLGFFERPIAAALGIVTILVWLWPLFRRLRSRRSAALG